MDHGEIPDSLERTSAAHLPAAHGGELVDLYADSERRGEIKTESREWPSWDLTARQLCDLELLLNGGFSPLTGFLCRADYEAVKEKMRLASGTPWPIPVTLHVAAALGTQLGKGPTPARRRPQPANRAAHPA